ncbi:twin-arginine translocation signal domain-containing protein [Halalkalicoccus tibetensis]|uniref:Twin-arginine translocation signal domain-containing protein n=1 Tax=Halalkalicoccus tibetensis TaxID=175632 RepID=A0ABD5UZM5_9EURY
MEGSSSGGEYDRPRVSRRRFVKALGAGGIGAASASHLATEGFEGSKGEAVRIVYAHAREDPEDPTSLTPRTRTVSADWYDDLQAALASYEAFDWSSIEGVRNASVVPGEDGGRSSISVGALHEGAVERIGDLLDGTPVEGSILESSTGDEFETLEPARRFDPDGGVAVPGGVACGEAEGLATLAPAIYDPGSGERYFATAEHLYEDADIDELTLVTSEGRIEIGSVVRRYHSEDLALIAPTREFTPDHALDGDTTRRVAGQFTRLGLADLKARGVDIHKVGAMSGHTTGRIQAIDGISCVYGDPCKRGQLKWGSETEFTDGDSGSVSYAPDPEHPDEQVLVCGLNNARTWWPGEDYIWGTGAYALQEEYGYTF